MADCSLSPTLSNWSVLFEHLPLTRPELAPARPISLLYATDIIPAQTVFDVVPMISDPPVHGTLACRADEDGCRGETGNERAVRTGDGGRDHRFRFRLDRHPVDGPCTRLPATAGGCLVRTLRHAD